MCRLVFSFAVSMQQSKVFFGYEPPCLKYILLTVRAAVLKLDNLVRYGELIT